MSAVDFDTTVGGPPAPAVRIRTFSEIHADVWCLIRTHPLIFLVMPAVVTVLFGAMLEAGFRASSEPLGAGLPRVGYFLSVFAAQVPAAIVLSGLREIAEGRRADFAAVLRTTWPACGRILLAMVLAWIRVLIGMLLLIVPGLYLGLRYVLINPAAVLDDAVGGDAIRSGAAAMRGRYWRTLGMIVAATLIYVPWALISVTPEGAPRIMSVLEELPMGIVAAWANLAGGLIYLDRTGRTAPRPAGSDAQPVLGARRSVLLAAGLGWVALFLFLLLTVLLPT